MAATQKANGHMQRERPPRQPCDLRAECAHKQLRTDTAADQCQNFRLLSSRARNSTSSNPITHSTSMSKSTTQRCVLCLTPHASPRLCSSLHSCRLDHHRHPPSSGAPTIVVILPRHPPSCVPSSLPLPCQAIIKPQYVDHIPKAVKGKVGEILKKKDERDAITEAVDTLDLHPVFDREVDKLSGSRAPGAMDARARWHARARTCTHARARALTLARTHARMQLRTRRHGPIAKGRARLHSHSPPRARARVVSSASCASFSVRRRRASAFRHRRRAGSEGGRLHVRRALFVLGRDAAPQGGAGDPLALADQH
eukprot:2394115-Pleurochrysis_carterae.AAC.3